MKRNICIITALFFHTFLFSLHAQTDAKKLLDKAAAAFQNGGGIKAEYVFTMNGQKGSGMILIQGQKFMNDLGEQVVWFDGKTMWTLVRSNEEVNVTEPSAQEIASMNPYAFVSMYKKGYTPGFGKSTTSYHEILLKPSGRGATAKQILLRLNKQTLQPVYMKMQTTDRNEVEIVVKSLAKGQKFGAGTFTFNPKLFPDVEVIDLR